MIHSIAGLLHGGGAANAPAAVPRPASFRLAARLHVWCAVSLLRDYWNLSELSGISVGIGRTGLQFLMRHRRKGLGNVFVSQETVNPSEHVKIYFNYYDRGLSKGLRPIWHVLRSWSPI
jgi:hypothetical protein